ncbi:hypothetical protein FOH10_16130 [Nocardia otitidiscaviarum]|uniref:Knr4/Smi1-like domain-containing protein n=1 Tax=Nocardia otitidiscaviarum TaxID=1823 RepID=A0A516NM76_9NOCA|nr:SMI1/KNR4 family protein [Nocardia otitidiscaviarum]MCP9624846.1 SMI1/KNR4 family protein [Nocardia otitidiscaviarum]QDP80010.1 hypothetical protein FOH10_16130 [Nocardia otitidiscaviarum]
MRALDVFAAYVDWLRNNVPLAFENLAGPVTPGELAALENTIGRELPPEVKAVLGMHNGQLVPSLGYYDHGVPCIPTLTLLSANEIEQIWRSWDDARDHPATVSLQRSGAVYPGAEGLIKPLYTSPGWIPLWADAERPDYIGLDFDPGPRGTPGQIINFGSNEEHHYLCAPDFTDLLEFLLEQVAIGAWPASVITHDDEEEDDREPTPWFGDPRESFFNALYDRFETRPRH